MKNINELIAAYKALKDREKQLKKDLEVIATDIQNAMVETGSFELKTAAGVARLTEVNARRFDAKSFKNDHAELYAAYTVTRNETRFTVK